MENIYEVAIIGAGPAGLGAATNAAYHGLSHVLIEKGEVGNTVFEYQLRKHVMAEPSKLPLRSKINFQAGTREEVLGVWNKTLEDLNVNTLKAEVLEIKKREDVFFIKYSEGEIAAKKVVLAIGVQGSPRKLNIPGAELPHVQYKLRDPDEFQDLDIVVVGGGDAAIENALALAKNNRVNLINRQGEFARAKNANSSAILAAIKNGDVKCFYDSDSAKITKNIYHVTTPEGEVQVKCDLVIARIGAIMPRKFLETCDIKFTSESREAIPIVSAQYESSVSGLYILGALIGYPLIKQAINQGYEVIEHIVGNEIEPADQVLINESLSQLPGTDKENYNLIQKALPLFNNLTESQFRELLIESSVQIKKAGEQVFKYNDYSDSFYSIVEGSVSVVLEGGQKIEISNGDFFGEMSLLSGRRRSATIVMKEDGILLETPRTQILKLISSVEDVSESIDRRFLKNILETKIFYDVDSSFINNIIEKAHFKRLAKGEVLFKEGEQGDDFCVIRKGSLKVSRLNSQGQDIAQTYLPAGNYVGEMALIALEDDLRTATVSAAVSSEIISISKDIFSEVLAENPETERRIRKLARARQVENLTSRDDYTAGMLDFIVEEGVTDADNVLVIDSDLCVACDNCESACAATHSGYSRLDRKGGASFAAIQVPISCRHCENPLCMLDCPPDALSRLPNGEVVINDSCIACENCVKNCPYGVIQMVYDSEPSLWSWLFKNKEQGQPKAGKCDMCRNLKGGPACVRACPTGAAMRIHPSKLLKIISDKGTRDVY